MPEGGRRPFRARPLFGIAPGGACRAGSVTSPAVGSYPTVSPSPSHIASDLLGLSLLCGAFPGVTPAGRYPAPFLHGARTFLAPMVTHKPAVIRPSARSVGYGKPAGTSTKYRGKSPRQIGGKACIGCIGGPRGPRAKPQTKGGQDRIFGCIGIAKGAGIGEKSAWVTGGNGRIRPDRQPLTGQTSPIKPGAGVAFSGGGHVGMRNHPMRRDRPAGQDVGQKGFQRLHLPMGKRMIPPIGQFDADGMAVDIVQPRPLARARMPSAVILGHQSLGLALFGNQPMGRNFGQRVAQPIPRGGATGHRGIMQDNDRRARSAPSIAEIRRRKAQFSRNGAGSQAQA